MSKRKTTPEVTVSVRKVAAQKVYTVTVQIDTETTASGDLTPGICERSEIISSIIRMKYSADAMEAIINNKLQSPEDEAVAQEFADMQNWRKFAKNKADEAMAYAMEHGMISQPEQEE